MRLRTSSSFQPCSYAFLSSLSLFLVHIHRLCSSSSFLPCSSMAFVYVYDTRSFSTSRISRFPLILSLSLSAHRSSPVQIHRSSTLAPCTSEFRPPTKNKAYSIRAEYELPSIRTPLQPLVSRDAPRNTLIVSVFPHPSVFRLFDLHTFLLLPALISSRKIYFRQPTYSRTSRLGETGYSLRCGVLSKFRFATPLPSSALSRHACFKFARSSRSAIHYFFSSLSFVSITRLIVRRFATFG